MREAAGNVDEAHIAPRWLRAVGLVLLALVLSMFTWAPMFAAYPKSHAADGTYIHEMLEAARVSMARWHELPLWNPYQCGGIPLWDNPQGMGAALPYWLLLLPTNTTRAMELWYMLHSAAGFLSMYVFARQDVRASRGAAILASAMWAFCGANVQHICNGGFNWVPFFFLPLVLYLWRGAERDARMAVGFGIVMALQLWGGGAYPVAFMLLIVAAETLTRMWPSARVVAILKAAAIALAVTIGFAAARLIPVMYQISTYKRQFVDDDALKVSTLVEMFLARTHARPVPGQQYVWGEYNSYVGLFLVGLTLLGIALGGAENAWLLALLLFALALMFGHQGRFAPWEILHAHIQPFTNMRVPTRFNAAVTTFMAAYVAIAVDRGTALVRRVSGSSRIADAARTVLLVVGLVGVGDMIGTHLAWLPGYFTGPVQNRKVAVSPNFYYEGAGLADFIDQPQQNRGRFQCWEEWTFELGGALWAGDVPQARAQDATKAQVANVTRTQNTFTFDVDAKEPTRILLNSAFDYGWRTTAGKTGSENHLLAVDVPAGHNHVRVKYWPRGLTAGLVLTCTTVVGIIAFFVLDARRRRRAVI